MTAGKCPGCVGRGTGSTCCICDQPIPDTLRRGQRSVTEKRDDCADCAAGRRHDHRGTWN